MSFREFIVAGIAYFTNVIFNIERDIYCATNCKVELPLHRKYYAEQKARYNRYLRLHYPDNTL